MNLSCTICADAVSPNDGLSVTKCGHMFHARCLATWLERSSTCPQCRCVCPSHSVVKLYLTTSLNETVHDDPIALQNENDALKLDARRLEQANKKLTSDLSQNKTTQKKARDMIKSLEAQVEQKNLLIRSQELVNNELRAMNNCIPELRAELQAEKAQLNMLDAIQNVIKSSVAEVEKLLQNGHSIRSLSTMVVVLKREIRASEQKRQDMRKLMIAAQAELKNSQAYKAKLLEQISTLESDLHKALEDRRNSRSENRTSTSPVVIRSTLAERNNAHNRIANGDGTTEIAAAANATEIAAPKNDSPYLKVSSSSLGLAVLPMHRRKRLNARSIDAEIESSRRQEDQQSRSGEAASGAAAIAQYGIFQRPRITAQMSALRDSNRVFNGLGGTDRRDMFAAFKQRTCDSPK